MDIDREQALRMYRRMLVIRRFEETVVDLVDSDDIAGVTHEYIGQEAVAVGVCEALGPRDLLTSTHRGHGHMLARGADPSRMMAELMGRETGVNRGRGGSMHMVDFELGFLGANGIVAAGAPIAAGAAWAARAQGSDAVAVCFFGDGGVNQGVLHEALNLAAIWKIPVIFCCENNQYAMSLAWQRSSLLPIAERMACYGMPVEVADGMDPVVVLRAASAAVERARSGRGPTFIECRTYRFAGHHTAERAMKLTYRSEEEIDEWSLRDPLITFRHGLVEAGYLTDADDTEMRRLVDQEIDAAVEFGRRGEIPNADEALDLVYATGTDARFPARGWLDR